MNLLEGLKYCYATQYEEWFNVFTVSTNVSLVDSTMHVPLYYQECIEVASST